MTPERALYEYRRPGDPPPPIPWEELAPEGRDFYAGQFAAGVAACPEVAAMRERLAAVEEIAFRHAGDVDRGGIAHPSATAVLAAQVLRALGHHAPEGGKGRMWPHRG